DLGQRLAWFDKGARRDKARQFIAGKQSLFHGRVPSDARVFSMRHDRAAQVLGPSTLSQNFVSSIRMVFERRPALVVEVVKQPGKAPEFFVRAKLSGIGANARLDCKGV